LLADTHVHPPVVRPVVAAHAAAAASHLLGMNDRGRRRIA
jgi:hypothetical protein